MGVYCFKYCVSLDIFFSIFIIMGSSVSVSKSKVVSVISTRCNYEDCINSVVNGKLYCSLHYYSPNNKDKNKTGIGYYIPILIKPNH